MTTSEEVCAPTPEDIHNRTYRAAAQVWSARLGGASAAVEIRDLGLILSENLRLRFTFLRSAQITQIVEHVLLHFLPPLFLRSGGEGDSEGIASKVEERRGPDELTRSLGHHALAVFQGDLRLSGEPCCDERPPGPDISKATFGEDHRRFVAALTEAQEVGSFVEYHVVAVFMDMKDELGGPPHMSKVAAALKPLGFSLTPDEVQYLLFQFKGRLLGLAR